MEKLRKSLELCHQQKSFRDVIGEDELLKECPELILNFELVNAYLG